MRRIILLFCLSAVPNLAHAEPITVESKQVPLVSSRPEIDRVDRLRFLGGLSLDAWQHGLGGLSGLDLDSDGSLIAVMDNGFFVRLRPTLDAAGRLAGIASAEMIRLALGEDRRETGSKGDMDAEAIARAPDGSLIVAFEGDHRLMRYAAPDDPAPRRLDMPDEILNAHPNGGFESLALLPDGRTLLVSESHPLSRENVAAWVGRSGDWTLRPYPVVDGYLPTGAAALSDGGALMVERLFGIFEGQHTRIRYISAATLSGEGPLTGQLLADLTSPITVDNFEGIAAEEREEGAVRIWLVADDNFNMLQRNLLFLFEWIR